MDIGLVSHVEDQTVAAGIEGFLDGKRRLDDAEVRRKVTAGLRDVLDEELPQLPAEPLVLIPAEPEQIVAAVNVL